MTTAQRLNHPEHSHLDYLDEEISRLRNELAQTSVISEMGWDSIGHAQVNRYAKRHMHALERRIACLVAERASIMNCEQD